MSVLMVAGMISALLLPASRLSADMAATARAGVPLNGTPAVGALFTAAGGSPAQHFCSASVVHSPGGNLLITAAHCLTGRSLRPAGRIMFAPGYHDGEFPYGSWPVTAEYVDSQWSLNRDPNDDVAFLAVRGSGSAVLEAQTGAETLAVGQRPPLAVRVIGYPDSGQRPLRCQAPTRAFDAGRLHQLVFDCDDYTNGTSGGPFLVHVNAKTGTGRVVGVIGGYQEGGDTPSVSYSPQFGSRIQALYDTAARS